MMLVVLLLPMVMAVMSHSFTKQGQAFQHAGVAWYCAPLHEAAATLPVAYQ